MTIDVVRFITVLRMSAQAKSCEQRILPRALLIAVVAGVTVVMPFSYGRCSATDGTMRIVPDRDVTEQVDTPSPSHKPSEVREESRDHEPSSEKSLASEEKHQESPVLIRRKELIAEYEPLRRKEFDRLLRIVHVLDKDDAVQWMIRFISSPPFNCPFESQKAWIDAIMSAAESNSLPMCKEILGLLASIVSIESGFHADPPAIDPSRGEDMDAVLTRAEEDLFQKMGRVMSVPPVPQLYKIYRKRFYPKLMACRTERDVEIVARSIAKNLKNDADSLPDFLKNIVCKGIDKVKNVVRSKGSMQINFPRARQVVKERGDPYTDDELTEYLYTMKGGVDVGAAALKPMFVQYGALYGKPGDLSWLFFVGMDYHYGPFSSRNMMEQIRIRDLSSRKIPLDGDFLHYDEDGTPLEQDSETLRAAVSVFSSEPRDAVYETFLLEKHPHYVYTDLHQAIAKAHLNRFGPTPFAVIGDLWMGESTRIKHGTTWKTKAYLKKLDRHLNSIPWDD